MLTERPVLRDANYCTRFDSRGAARFFQTSTSTYLNYSLLSYDSTALVISICAPYHQPTARLPVGRRLQLRAGEGRGRKSTIQTGQSVSEREAPGYSTPVSAVSR